MNEPLTPDNEAKPDDNRLSPIASMDELTAGENFPKPDEEAIAAIQKARETESKQPAPNAPEVFDPSLHATGKDGKPSITAGGKFRKKKGAQFKRPEETAKAAERVEAERKSLKAAIATSAILEQLSVMAISDEFVYTELERTSNIKAWEDTYDYYGGISLYPPLELAANHIAIIAVRANKEKTKPKLMAGLAWMKAKFTWKRKKKNGTHISSGNDGRGQNDLGAEKSMVAAKD